MDGTGLEMDENGAYQGTFAAWIRENDAELILRILQGILLLLFASLAFLTQPEAGQWVLRYLLPSVLLVHVIHHVVRVVLHRRHIVFERAFVADMDHEGAMQACLEPDHTFWKDSHTFQALRSLHVRPGLDRMLREGLTTELEQALDLTWRVFRSRGTGVNLFLLLAWSLTLFIPSPPVWVITVAAIVIVMITSAEVVIRRMHIRQHARLKNLVSETAASCIEILRNETGRAAEAARPFKRTEPIRRRPWRR